MYVGRGGTNPQCCLYYSICYTIFKGSLYYTRGLQVDRETFSKCLLWATAPIIPEYEGITTTHLFHPDEWKPFAPSGTTRNEIAIWQYGRDCHPIPDDSNNMTVFNIDLIHDVNKMIEYMY